VSIEEASAIGAPARRDFCKLEADLGSGQLTIKSRQDGLERDFAAWPLAGRDPASADRWSSPRRRRHRSRIPR